jgi:hypothetical protein
VEISGSEIVRTDLICTRRSSCYPFWRPRPPTAALIATPRDSPHGGCNGRLVDAATGNALEFRLVGCCYRLWTVDVRQDPRPLICSLAQQVLAAFWVVLAEPSVWLNYDR